jgi:hypothetical protein
MSITLAALSTWEIGMSAAEHYRTRAARCLVVKQQPAEPDSET